ncbi:MAG: hypothetical protein ABR915_15165, partial [Thermoguttaceae bacterium]
MSAVPVQLLNDFAAEASVVSAILPPASPFPGVRPKRRPRRHWCPQPCRCRPSLVERHLAEGRRLVDPQGNLSPSYRAAKRTLDIVGALAILLAL